MAVHLPALGARARLSANPLFVRSHEKSSRARARARARAGVWASVRARACVGEHPFAAMANEAHGRGEGDSLASNSLDLSTSLERSVQTRIFKIIVIGDSNVGKTCLTFRFTGGSFPAKTEATIGVDFREKAVEIEGERIKVGHGEGGK